MHVNETWANLNSSQGLGLGSGGQVLNGTIALGDALRLHPSQEEQVGTAGDAGLHALPQYTVYNILLYCVFQSKLLNFNLFLSSLFCTTTLH